MEEPTSQATRRPGNCFRMSWITGMTGERVVLSAAEAQSSWTSIRIYMITGQGLYLHTYTGMYISLHSGQPIYKNKHLDRVVGNSEDKDGLETKVNQGSEMSLDSVQSPSLHIRHWRDLELRWGIMSGICHRGIEDRNAGTKDSCSL
jgi:hypothetical protein